MQSGQLHSDQWWPLPCHTQFLIKRKTVIIENLFQVQWKNDTFHLHEFCRQPFHYNTLIHWGTQWTRSFTQHAHATYLKDYWKTWNIWLLPECGLDFQSPETLHSISGFFTNLSEQCVCPTLKGRAAQKCWKSCNASWWDVCFLFQLITMLVQKHINQTPSY